MTAEYSFLFTLQKKKKKSWVKQGQSTPDSLQQME